MISVSVIVLSLLGQEWTVVIN